jgi:eukaryotic-like serine/threonine-protein kinase
VIDWGLAKDLARPSADDDLAGDPYRSAAPELTTAGSVIGTPQYMAPEQARGEAVDKRADVYALGALLYHVLSGEPPYAGDTSGDVLTQVRAEEPVALGERSQAIPKDLAAIVGKAMARQPGERYASAAELVEDLKRFQTGQLVGAQEYSAATLVWRWMARHRAPLAVALVFLVASSAMALVGVRRIAHARDTASAERNKLILLQAHSSLEKDPTKTIEWLKTYPLDGSDWTTVQTLAARAKNLGVARYLLPTGIVVRAVTSPDGKLVATIGTERKVMLWDVEHGALVDSLKVADNPQCVRFSPDGKQLAISGSRGLIVLWDRGSHGVRKLGPTNTLIVDLQYSPDGTKLASSGVGGARLWSLSDGSARLIPGPVGEVANVLFNPDGSALYTMGEDGRIFRVRIADGSISSFEAHRGIINHLGFSKDGALLATGGTDHAVRIWPAGLPEGRLLTMEPSKVVYCQFLADSHRVIAVNDSGVASVWDADSGSLLVRSAQLLPDVRVVGMSLDGSLISAAGPKGEVKLWDWRNDQVFALRGQTGAIMATAFVSDGSLVVAGMDAMRVWTPSMRPTRPRRVTTLVTGGSHVVWSPDGSRFATESGKGVDLCVTATAECRHLLGHLHLVYGVVFSPDGSQLLSAARDGTARLWSVADGSSRVLKIGGSEVRSPIFMPDGEHVAAAGSDGLVYVWPTAGGDPIRLRGHAGEVRDVAISPDGQVLASGGADGTVRLWDWRKESGRVLGSHDAFVFHIAFSPDGKALASGARDVVVWDLAHGTSRRLVRYADDVSAVSYSPDGRYVASGSWDGSAQVWDTTTGRSQMLGGHENRVRAVSWSLDSRFVLTGSDDETIHVWDVATGALEVLDANTASVRAFAFSPVDASLAVTSDDRTVSLWNALQTPVVPSDPARLNHWMSTLTNATLH